MASSGLIWGTATLMVFVVSCCSLVGVSIMPLISGRLYKSFITLFTGLAVGSLLGSAIFSLVPQAFSIQAQADRAYLWKSLVIFFGIYLFYCSERFMRIYFDRKTQQQKDRAIHQEELELKNHTGNDVADGQQQIAHKPDISNKRETNVPNADESLSTTSAIQTAAIDNHDRDTVAEIYLRKSGEDGKLSNRHTHEHHHHHHGDSMKPHEIITNALQRAHPTTSSVANLPRLDVTKKASEIAPVAWMIIIGDSLHNFIDGLSIGAAFTKSLHQGLIICTAVIFEELPHELGDFAVLISSGMTVGQALKFNFLSACTCFIGMALGIILGDLTESASYIFALAAGMFFYISLVDMMGELSASLEECKHSIKESAHLLLMQNIGILSGIIIMFLLALFGPDG